MSYISKNEWYVAVGVLGLVLLIGILVIALPKPDDQNATNAEPQTQEFNGGYGDTSTLAQSSDPNDLATCRFMHYRWLYYQQRDGTHLPDTHDPLVMRDAAEYFEISESEAKDRLWRSPKVDYNRLRLTDFESEFPPKN